MQLLVIVLRLIHILFGVFWAGSMFFLVSFLLPTARDAGPAGAPFMRRFMRSAFPNAVAGSAVLTVLSGIGLMWNATSLGGMAWFSSRTGMTLSTGGLAAIVALGIGLSMQRPTTKRITALADAIEAGGGAPSAEQSAEIGALQAKAMQAAQWIAILLAVAVVCMAVARYL